MWLHDVHGNFLSHLLRHACSTLFPYTTLFRSEGPGARGGGADCRHPAGQRQAEPVREHGGGAAPPQLRTHADGGSRVHLTDRKSTRLNSSHGYISYAVFCLKKKITTNVITSRS